MQNTNHLLIACLPDWLDWYGCCTCREGGKEVWYYSTKAHIEELMESLDGKQWERELLYALQEMKDDLLKQVSITEDLTASNKGSKKSIIEIETGKIYSVRDMYY